VYEDADEDLAKRDGLPAPPAESPKQLARYLILEEIGRGGMGVVYTAYDPKLDRKVAIKILKNQKAMGNRKAVTRRARLVREAQALAKLNHPNIVTVHDVDTFEDQLYMAMEYFEGETLISWVHDAKRTWREILEAFDQAGEGLAAAHAANITHRDFKPTNVLINEDGRVKVLDFGLAKSLGHDESLDHASDDRDEVSQRDLDIPAPRVRPPSDPIRRRLAGSSDIMEFVGSASGLRLTQAGRLVGTPAYMAPEQHAGAGLAKVGAWTDQFAFAVSLYESLYGDLPFEGEFLDEVYWNINNGKVTEPPKDTEVPAWVFRIVKKALSSEPDDRYPSMDAMLAALRDDPRKKQRRVAMFAGGAGLIMLGAFGVYQAVWGGDEPQPCHGAEARLAGVWDEATKSSVREALLATKLPYALDAADRVSTTLDDYASRWVDTRTSVCEATRVHAEQSEALLDVRMACLDQRASELGALVGVLEEADESVAERAVAAASGLGALDDCVVARADGAHALPTDPELRKAVEEVWNDIGDARVLTLTGRFREALELAQSTTQQARQLERRGLVATALRVEARALRETGKLDEARSRLEESIVHAAAARDAQAETGAWKELIFVTGYFQGQPRTARNMQLAVEAAIERNGSKPKDRIDLALNMGSVEGEASEFEDSRRYFEQALELSTRHFGPRHRDTATALRNLAIVEFRLGDVESATVNFERALEITTELLGSKHPDVAQAAFNLGNALSQNHPLRARELYEQALGIREEVYGPESVKVAQVLNSIGALHKKAGRNELARETYERALGVFLENDQAVPAAATLNNLGLLEMSLSNPKGAIQRHEEALKILESRVGDTHRSVGRTRLHLCHAHIEVGSLVQGERQCVAALDVFRDVYSDPHSDIADALETLADIAEARGDSHQYQKRLEEALEAQRQLRESG
jgi:serine/threonine protein kinase/Tfp pilus assembly protein PilF